jgi:hypothetical protein
MMTGPPAPDDRHRANGRRAPAAGRAGGDPADARRARLASFWLVVLQRFRDYAQRPASRPPGAE